MAPSEAQVTWSCRLAQVEDHLLQLRPICYFCHRRCLCHRNRFVREAALGLAAALCDAFAAATFAVLQRPTDKAPRDDGDTAVMRTAGEVLCTGEDGSVDFEELAMVLAPRLSDGLTDNWSQVCKRACRVFQLHSLFGNVPACRQVL
jgi:hypothetical protein